MGDRTMANMGSTARAGIFGLLATVLIIATVCVLDEPMSAIQSKETQESAAASPEEEIHGHNYLKSLAKKLDAKHETKKNEDSSLGFNMLHSFQDGDNDEAGDALRDSIAKDAAESHPQLGAHMPTFDENGFPMVSAPDLDLEAEKHEQPETKINLPPADDEYDFLLQVPEESSSSMDESSWVPAGQDSIHQKMQQVKAEKKQRQDEKEDEQTSELHHLMKGAFDVDPEDSLLHALDGNLEGDTEESKEDEEATVLLQKWHPSGQSLVLPKDDNEKVDAKVPEANQTDDILEELHEVGAIKSQQDSKDFIELDDFDMELLQAAVSTGMGSAAGSGKPGSLPVARKNAATLKAYSQSVRGKISGSQVFGEDTVIGSLIRQMSVKEKMTPEEQYSDVMAVLSAKFTAGLPKYLLGHITEAMSKPAGILVMGPISGKSGNMVYIGAKFLGLADTFDGVKRLSTPASDFIHRLAIIDGEVAAHTKLQREKKAAHLTVADFNSLFKPACIGEADANAACSKLSQGACGHEAGCRWSNEWDGREVFQIMDNM